MGSHLEVAANRIWLDFADLAFGGLKQLAIDAAGVRAEALVGSAYEDLAEFLAATHRVIPFPYDWRRSIVESGDRLAAEVTQALETAERDRQPIRFLAHSMGGLVVRHFLAAHPALWRRVAAQPGSRVLFLGTPHRGSHTIARLLVGQEGTLRKLAMLDVTSSHEQLLRIIARFPGALELLPSDGPDDFFATAFWEDLRARGGDGWAAPDREALRSARRALDRIPETDLELERMLYVAGRAPATPVAVRAGRDADGDPVVELLATGRGDGRVAWDTIPRGMRRWFVDAEHGDLAAHEPAFPALLELLQTGSTSRLPNTEPAVARAVEEPFVLPPEPEPMLPDEGTLAAAALGGRPPRRRRPVPATRVRVSIRHGNLAYAKHPVAVGHYLGDTIVGAEAFLDHALDGRLRRRQALGLYPGRIETCEVWVNPRDQGKPGGGIIVGLGRVGELTPGGLEASFARAALTYAATVADHPGRRFQAPEGVPRAARITSLLIGTGAENLTVRDSVEAILRGLRRANEQLDATGQRKRVVLDEIEFLELWEDRAIEGAQALADLANDPALRPHFEVQPRVRGGEGGLVRVHRSEEPGWWHRLSIAAEPDGGLRFVSLTTRARAEVRLQPNQRPLVDRFVERAITTVGNTRETAGTLFELLLPNPLKEQAPRQGRLVLVLDEQSARYPWELLEDSWDRRDQPLAVRAGLLRQLKTETFREHAPAGTEQTAFVVGDPVTEFTPLPGAAEEAAAAATLLARRGFQVAKLIRSDALSIVSQLFARPYRVLHLAGHGVHEFDAGAAGGPKVSGLVLGNGLFLTPPDVQKMRMVPELVFLNCCHLGRTDRTQAGRRDSRRDDRHRFAANLAAEFIRMGVRAVIAAGWAVDDEAARTFAGTFYDRLLDGAPFGDAVLQARSETWHQHPGVNTWGAYQCYGDPSMTLAVRAEWGAPDRRAEAPYALPSELVAELRNVASQAATETLSEGWRTRLRERIQKALERSDPEWSRRADVAAALGLAWGELGDYARAVEGVTGALRADRADLPVRALEQRASFRCRWALEQWRRSGLRADPAPLALIEDALADLDALVGLAPSVERHCLRGAAWKLRAWMGRGAGRSKALDRMADAYRAALEHSGGAGRVPLLNWLTAEALLRAGGVKRKTDLAKELEERGRRLEEAARAADLEEPGSSNSVTISDLAVVRVLAGAEPEELRAAIVEGYEEARRRGAGAQELEAVRENLEFVLAVLGKPRRGRGAGGRAKAHPAALLREVLERLA
jgi:tetratricopeptide (TPR) repeat protein